MEDVFEIKELPKFGYLRGKYSKEELKELVDFSNQLGITLIPCVQTLGHMGQFLRWPSSAKFKDTSDVLKVGSEDTYRLITLMLKILMKQLGISSKNRPVVDAALKRAEDSGGPAVALQLNDGRIITGKTTSLLGASAALLLNTLKELGGIHHDIYLISPIVIEPIQVLKVEHMGNRNPRLHTDEILIALSICAATNPTAALAMQELSKLRGCQAHSTVILSGVDENVFSKLGVHITCEPQYQSKKLYHK